MANLTSVSVSPSSPFILTGTTQQFTATAHYSDQPDIDITTNPLTTWASATTSVAIINSVGLATAQSISGSSIISASFGGFDGYSTLIVGIANYIKILEQLVEGVKVTETVETADHNPIAQMTVPVLSMVAGGVTFKNGASNAGGPIGYTVASGHPGDFTKLYMAEQAQTIGQWVQLNSSQRATTVFNTTQRDLGVVKSIAVVDGYDGYDGYQLAFSGSPVLVQIAGEAYVSTTDNTIVIGSYLGPDINGKIKAIPFDPEEPTPILGFALEAHGQTYDNMVLMRIQICGE